MKYYKGEESKDIIPTTKKDNYDSARMQNYGCLPSIVALFTVAFSGYASGQKNAVALLEEPNDKV